MSGASVSEAFKAAVEIVRRLHGAGHVAYLAGGCVRDVMLGLEPKDYDVATDARPERVQALFKRTQAVGEAFGVVLVRSGSRTNPIQTEVATFRREWGYADGRRPDHVEFSDAKHDALRRDFTVNALFADVSQESKDQSPKSKVQSPEAGEAMEVEGVGVVIDYVGGLKDLKAKVVRAVGDAHERFGEDYLRMIRAVRFAARLGFDIDPATATAIRTLAGHVCQVSRERIGIELELMLAGANRAAAVQQLQTLGLDGPILNEKSANPALHTLTQLNTPDAGHVSAFPTALAAWMLDRHVLADTTQALNLTDGLTNALTDAAAFSRDQAGPTIKHWRRALCLSNQTTQRIQGMTRALTKARDWPALTMAAAKRTLAEPTWMDTCLLVQALDPKRAAEIERDAAGLRAQGLTPTPLVTGKDLLEMGLEAGPDFRIWLEAAYDEQLEGRLTNRAQALDWLGHRMHTPHPPT